MRNAKLEFVEAEQQLVPSLQLFTVDMRQVWMQLQELRPV